MQHDEHGHVAYCLIKKGSDLGEVLLAFVRWGKEYIPGTRFLKETAARAEPEPPAKRRKARD